jgi:fructoselysine 6-kinase
MKNDEIKRLVAVGFCCADVYRDLDKFYPTGNGVDWGIHLARMGIPVSVVSVVGTDAYGVQMRDALSTEGIDVSHLRREAGDTCIMLMGLKNDTDRVHLQEIEGVMATYALTDEENTFVKSHDMLHTDLFGHVLDHLAEWHDIGMKIVMDFSTFSQDPEYHCEEYFPYVDYVFMSYDDPKEAVMEWIRTVHSFGPKIVTATRGKDGSISYDGNRYYHSGIVPCEVVNTVGAGDSYIAGFTYGLIQGWDIPACQHNGAKVASTVISKFEPY